MKTREDADIEKRLLLAVLLSMAILFVTPYIYETFYPQSQSAPPAEVSAPEAAEDSTAQRRDSPLAESPQPLEEGLAPPAEQTEAEPRTIVVLSQDMELQFSNVGAVLRSARMKSFGMDHDNDSKLELIPQGLPEGSLMPLAFQLPGNDLDSRARTAVFEVQGAAGGTVSAPANLVFSYRGAELYLRKELYIPASGYSIEVKTEVRQFGRNVPYGLALGTGIGGTGDTNAHDFRSPAIAYWHAGSVERYDEGDLEEGTVELTLQPRWAAIDSKYFSLAYYGAPDILNLKMGLVEWPQSGQGGTEEVKRLVQGTIGLSGPGALNLYLGPKAPEELKAADPSLPGLINYGWLFGFLVKPLLVALKWIHGFFANYGWSIIILTFLINLALFPIRYKQMASMQKMAALQPQLKSIQDKYKRMKRDDPKRQQMNAEVMALYKQHGVNPLGGCLPLLLQMPILFAFYSMLDVSIELRGAPFMLWIQDLSRPDPYYVTPLVMGATMVAQQKMTPATGDPAQRRMMMFLPVVFTFFFLGVSSGLAIYFLFSNVFAMMFQFGLQKWKPELGTSRSRAKKAKA